MILTLDDALILCILDHIEYAPDFNALAGTNKYFNRVVSPILYCRSATQWGNSALLWAASTGMIETARKAFEAGADVNATDCYGCTPLILATRGYHTEMAKLLLGTKDRDVNAKDNRDCSALCEAIVYGNEELVRVFLATGDIELEMRYGYQTALMMAAGQGSLSILKMLLADDRVDINTASSTYGTALFTAATEGQIEAVKLLLEAGAEYSHVHVEGRNMVQMAAYHGHADVVRELLPLFENYNPQDLLCDVARNRHLEVLKVLLEFEGINVNWRDKQGRTALWWAVFFRQERMVKLLLTHRQINVNAANQVAFDPRPTGITPLILAAESGYFNIAKMLIEHRGIRIHAKDGNGRDALTAASTHGHGNIIQLLEDVIEG